MAGTLATLAGSESLTNKKLGSLTANGVVHTSGGDGTLGAIAPGLGTVTWGPVFALTAPVDGDFAWVNQGGASTTTTTNAVSLAAPTNSGSSWRIRKKAAPATPYTIEVAFILNAVAQDFVTTGFIWRQSSDGKFIVAGMSQDNTTFASAFDVALNAPHFSSLVYMKCTDNGTNRIVYTSSDGLNWIQIHSVGRTDFLTADEVGFGLDVSNTTYPAAMTLVHWKQY
jgi:hypothetical protein